jgi:hypothetical protein
VLSLALASTGCTATLMQTLPTGTPGRAPRTTELAVDVRPGGLFGGAELVTEYTGDYVGARGAHGRFGYGATPRAGSGEIWSADVGVTAGAGRPPFQLEQPTMFESGFFADLALRLAGHGEEPGRTELTRWGLHLVLGGRSRVWPAAEPPTGELAAGLGLRLSFDSDARAILSKAVRETTNAFGFR